MNNEEKDVKIPVIQLYDSLSIHKYTAVLREAQYKGAAPSRYIIAKNIPKDADRNNLIPDIIGTIQFHEGEISSLEDVNGIMNENLLAIVKDRLECFQNSKFKCRENELALMKIEEALMYLHKRTDDRDLLNIEGTHKVNKEDF